MKSAAIARWSLGLIVPMVAAVALANCGEDPSGKKKADAGVDAGPGLSPTEEAQLQVVARAMSTFHENTGGWPFGNGVWWVSAPANIEGGAPPSQSGSLWTGIFTTGDTALFVTTQQPTLENCTAPDAGGLENPCWNGPYLTPANANASLGATQWYDVWQHPLLYMYLPPPGGPMGGQSSSFAPNGEIVIWSMGPDGKDGFACTDGSCMQNLNIMAQGNPSQTGADDLIIVVADSAI